jgi:ParB family transcriptional regulator, chromosome partitioning protein
MTGLMDKAQAGAGVYQVEETRLPVARIASCVAFGRGASDPRKLHELARSMELLGQLQRIAVRPVPDGWEVIYGERRLQAARLLDWQELDVRIIDCDDAALLIIYAAENLQRDEPGLSEYLDVVVLLAEAGFDSKTIARVLTRSQDWVDDLLSIAKEPRAWMMADAGLLASPEAWGSLMQLPATSRRRLLESGEAISVEACRRELARIEVNARRRRSLLSRHQDERDTGLGKDADDEGSPA